MRTDYNIWYNLDNQANIYPAISDARNTNVFRISCTLKEKIDADILQQALDKSISAYPYYQMTIRRGLFWYYLEPINIKPEVIREDFRPCRAMFSKGEKTLLFQVSYFENRINLEVFHALADGGGALEFFNDIVYNYISVKHKNSLPESVPTLDRSAAPASKAEDGFLKHYSGKKETKSVSPKRAYSLEGTTIPFNNISVISARLNVKEVLALAKQKQTSLTAYLTALYICAIAQENMPTRYRHRDISITVPVDLRSIFPTKSFRNFFSVVSIRYNLGTSSFNFDSVLESVTEQLHEKIDPEALAANLNYNMAMQKSFLTRWVPLFIKNRVLNLAYRNNETKNTSVLSNVGRIQMPDVFSDYVQYFTCLLNPTPIHKVKLCVNSFKDTLSLDFTSVIEETDIQRYFIRHFAEQGLDVTVTSNRSD